MEQQQRRSPRFPFVASAEVLAESTGSRLSARISDLSASGCYVDTINPLPDGTLVQLRIFTETQTFEALARVVYSHVHLGMGLAFREVHANAQGVLEAWLPAVI